jgi:hypothetical protein
LITVLLTVIRIVLIAHDPDDLATVELKALAKDLDHDVATSSPRPGWAENSLVTSVLISSIPCMFCCFTFPDLHAAPR